MEKVNLDELRDALRRNEEIALSPESFFDLLDECLTWSPLTLGTTVAWRGLLKGCYVVLKPVDGRYEVTFFNGEHGFKWEE